MFARQHNGLRGPVRSYTETSTRPAMTGPDGKTYPEVRSEYTTEYDVDGRVLATGNRNPDGSKWLTNFTYDASGQVLKIISGVEGSTVTQTTYSYDQQGRLQNISDDARRDSPVVFRYDDSGRKTKIELSCSADYRPNTVSAGSPFDVADRAPNLPGGGSATTTYDEHDRATEVQVRDANGELLNRALRIYDAQGHIIEEKQILDNLEARAKMLEKIIPPEVRAKMLDESGLSADQLQRELSEELTKLMGGQSGPYSVSHRYDTYGRVSHTIRRIYNHK